MKSKVAVVRCDSYDPDRVHEAVREGIRLIGGLESIISRDSRILFKPNLLNKAAPERAVTTHPSVFDAVIGIFEENGYTDLFYGDSPGNPTNPEKIAETCGIKQIGDKHGLLFGEFGKGRTVDFPEGMFTKQFEISQAALSADAIVNVCKMKTHQLERITGGVKNMLGCVYGLNKGMSHAKYPDADSFGKMLVDLNRCLKPKLHIMDGIMAMEGNGPASGTAVPMNAIIISTDPVAMDSVFCRLVGLDPMLVPTIRYGEEYGLGRWRDEDIEILGADIQALANLDFDVSRDIAKEQKWKKLAGLRQILLKKPVIISDRCIKCGICVDACPVEGKAMHFADEKRDKPPVYQYDKCIRCYCCQEMCPQKAITVKTPILGRMFIYR